jgi:hypothetical protein
MFSQGKWPRSDLEPSFLKPSGLEARSLKFSRCSGRAKWPRSQKSSVFSMSWASQVTSKPEVSSFLDVLGEPSSRKAPKAPNPQWQTLNIYIYMGLGPKWAHVCPGRPMWPHTGPKRKWPLAQANLGPSRPWACPSLCSRRPCRRRDAQQLF